MIQNLLKNIFMFPIYMIDFIQFKMAFGAPVSPYVLKGIMRANLDLYNLCEKGYLEGNGSYLITSKGKFIATLDKILFYKMNDIALDAYKKSVRSLIPSEIYDDVLALLLKFEYNALN